MGLTVDQANAQARNEFAQQQAGFQQQAGQFNAAAQNAAGQFGAEAFNQGLLSNAQFQQQANLANAQARDAAAQRALQGGGLLGQFAGQQAQLAQATVDQFARLGATEREIEQARLLAQRAEFDREAADALQRLQLELSVRNSILGQLPTLVNTNQQGTTSGRTTTRTSDFGFTGWTPFG